MTDFDRRKYWFPAKRYGWGWGLPNCWQGWGVLIGYCVVLIPMIGWISHRSGPNASVLFAIAWTILLLYVVVRKGEPPDWRWGK